MNDAVITIKTPSELKRQAQQTAKEMGFSLSSLINAYLRQLVLTKTISFSLEEPASVQSIPEVSQATSPNSAAPSSDASSSAFASEQAKHRAEEVRQFGKPRSAANKSVDYSKITVEEDQFAWLEENAPPYAHQVLRKVRTLLREKPL